MTDLTLLLLGPAVLLTAGLAAYFMARTPRRKHHIPPR